jgi:hypothetical protein
VIAFVIALICYFAFYFGIEHRRTRKGPWEVVFTNNASGDAALMIRQPTLGIKGFELDFRGEKVSVTNAATNIVFRVPQQVPFEVPYGKCVFIDTTFLPGTVTLRLFGHEIELLPRTLIIDHRERAWSSDPLLVVEPVEAGELPKDQKSVQ